MIAKTMKILLLAGEESGVVYAARLGKILEKQSAAKGEKIEFKTYQDFFSTEDLGVFGVWEVVKRIFFFLRVKRTMERVIDEWRPDRVVTIDYPGLNLKLAKYAKDRGIAAIHIVCPQVWAWHKNRIPKIPRQMTKLLCFFPFEPAIFDNVEKPGFKAVFIGHPMVDIFKEEQSAGASAAMGRIAILPGSRMGEVMRHTPRLAETMRIVSEKAPGAKFTIPAANPRAEREIRRVLASEKYSSLDVEIVSGGAREILRGAKCAAVASGTATLEAALAGVPTVIVYAVSPLLAAFLRRAITGVKHVGLANIIAEKANAQPPLPELLQENFTPEKTAAYLVDWLVNPDKMADIRQKLANVLLRLSTDEPALERAAAEILD